MPVAEFFNGIDPKPTFRGLAAGSGDVQKCMVRPRSASSIGWGLRGLRQGIRPLGGAEAPGHDGYPHASVLL